MNDNVRIIRLIILSATTVALFCLVGGIALALLGQKDSSLVLLPCGTGVVGSLIGLLANTRADHPGVPTPVSITNSAADPVPVQDTQNSPHETASAVNAPDAEQGAAPAGETIPPTFSGTPPGKVPL